MIHLVIGGARSGKSAYAQRLTTTVSQGVENQVNYIATAENTDEEMGERIAHHKDNRPLDWQVEEVPLALSAAITRTHEKKTLLVDCLTLWLNNQLHYFPDQDFEHLFADLCQALENRTGNTVLVANEVGLGVIPMGPMNRRFVDLAGRLNQAVARVATKVTFMAAGLPLVMKPQGTE